MESLAIRHSHFPQHWAGNLYRTPRLRICPQYFLSEYLPIQLRKNGSGQPSSLIHSMWTHVQHGHNFVCKSSLQALRQSSCFAACHEEWQPWRLSYNNDLILIDVTEMGLEVCTEYSTFLNMLKKNMNYSKRKIHVNSIASKINQPLLGRDIFWVISSVSTWVFQALILPTWWMLKRNLYPLMRE